MPGTLFVVATPIGNLEDISARALRVLRDAAVIAAEDTRRTAHLLARYAIATPTTSLHEYNEAQKTPALVARLQQGEAVALVSDAGTPGIADPGRRLVRAAREAGIRVEPVPGPSAVTTALMASGLPADTFTFLGFPPTRSKDRQRWIESLRSAGRTVVFFEAPHRILQTLTDVQSALGDCHIVVGRELTKAHEQLVDGQISQVARRLSSLKGEFCVILEPGQAASPAVVAPTDDEIKIEFGLLTDSGAMTRRAAITQLARKHGMPAREIYAALERAKHHRVNNQSSRR